MHPAPIASTVTLYKNSLFTHTNEKNTFKILGAFQEANQILKL
jgi:hypothetical protein